VICPIYEAASLPTAMIEFRALGTVVLRTPEGEDIRPVLAQPKRVALLAYLAAARPHGFHRRDRLLALFWPEQDERHARWALNQALQHLRGSLGKQVVVSRGDGEVGVDPAQLACDVAQFETALDAGENDQALELYRGDLLDGFHLSGAGEFERWLEEERGRLRERAARAASALAQRHAPAQPIAAVPWARRALALSPEDEAAARLLIEVLSRSGDRAGAVHAYEEFARRLRAEYDVDPAPETQALVAGIRSRRTPAAGTRSDGPEPTTPLPVAPPHAGRSRGGPRLARTLGSLVLVAVGAFLVSPRLTRPPTAAGPNSNTIAVFPFAYRGSTTFAYLGDGMMDLLSASLDGAGDLRTVDPHNVLAAIAPAGEDGTGPEQARAAAARLQAGSFVVGDVVEAGGRLRITARLYPRWSDDQAPASVSVEGEPTRVFRLVDGLTARLIAARSGGPAASLTRLAALTTDSLAALKAYLEGERQFRAGHMDSALAPLERAIQIDSTFALADYRIATLETWQPVQRPQAGEAVRRALRFAPRLGDRNRRLVEALAATFDERLGDAERIYREIVSRYPDDVEASYQLGELIVHRGVYLGHSWLDARAPLERVVAIDPDHQDALFHLANIAARERRLGALDSLTDHLLRIDPQDRKSVV